MRTQRKDTLTHSCTWQCYIENVFTTVCLDKPLVVHISPSTKCLSIMSPLHLLPTYLFLPHPPHSMAAIVTMETERVWRDAALWMSVCGWVASWDFRALFLLCPERKYQLMTSKKELPHSQTVFLKGRTRGVCQNFLVKSSYMQRNWNSCWCLSANFALIILGFKKEQNCRKC